MAGEKQAYTPESVKAEMAKAKYGEKQAAKGVVVSNSGMRENAADVSDNIAKWTVPLSLVGAAITAPFVPIVSAGLLANAGQDYMFNTIAQDERKKLKEKRMTQAKKQAAKEGKVVLDNEELTTEMKRRKKIEMNLRVQQGTVFEPKKYDLAA